MVKLRSRKIRSPFSAGSMNHQQINSSRRRNNNNSSQGSSSSQQQGRRSQRRQSNSSNHTASDQRRPFESLDSAHSSHSFASPGTKRKPESRGITASIRRARTAMFRMASSPLNNQTGGGDRVGASARRASSSLSADLEQEQMMDTADEGAALVVGETLYTSPADAAVAAAAIAFQRSPSQEENIPPLALLSPNCGTFFAHAAGADLNAMEMDDTKPRAAMTQQRTKNALEWMREDAPPELLPKLLSFCGSRKMNALSQVNKAWNNVMKDESVWRVLCEDTHKWSVGDEVPQSWAQLYKQSPCVPIDYDTVESAFDSVSSGQRLNTVENNVMQQYREQRTTCRILLHPGPYFLRKPLVANVVGDVELTIESVRGVRDPEHAMTWRQNYHKSSSSGDEGVPAAEDSSSLLQGDYAGTRTARRPTSPTLRQIFGSCGPRSSSSSVGALDRSSGSHGSDSDSSSSSTSAAPDQSANRALFHQSCFSGPGRPKAVLCLESRRENEPVIRVRQGTVNIRGLKFLHYCEGTDIWNGNAAIQVQRAFGRNGRPLHVEAPSVPPTANVSDCDIMSLSGRGLVVIDGAISHIVNCNVHNSAATGVYVGGAGSMATMTQTDVIENGSGNTRNQRGVARGHSGVYVEQGLAKIVDCNISGNSLTGISATSTVQARLHIEESDIRGNRTDQMELPPVESGRSINRNNSISDTGRGQPRSESLQESMVLSTPRGRSEPSTPQSPL